MIAFSLAKTERRSARVVQVMSDNRHCWILLAPRFAMAADLPTGWIAAGSHPAEYQMGVDTTVRHSGKGSGFIKATAAELHGFGTLMQMAVPGEYLGKRVRFSSYVRSEKVQSGWAGPWFRIDGPKPGDARQTEPLGFDNMQERPIKGTTDWRRYEVVISLSAPRCSFARTSPRWIVRL